MMRCRMTTCGTFTFEGKSRALPVTVTRCLRNIFRCRSARHWRGSVVMLNGDLRFDRSYRFNFCCDLGSAQVEQQLQVQQLQPQQFRQLLQYQPSLPAVQLPVLLVLQLPGLRQHQTR